MFGEVDAVLQKRQTIQERYLRGITSTTTLGGTSVEVLYEKFITDLASGYLSGEVTYSAEIIDQSEAPAHKILKPSAELVDPDTAAQMKYIITHLSSKNNDHVVRKALFHDAVLFGACYERELDLQDNSPVTTDKSSSADPNYTFYSLSALNTVALFSTDISDIATQTPVGLISVYTLDARSSEDNQEHTLYYCIECNPYSDTYQTSIYDKTTTEDETNKYKPTVTLKEEKESTHKIPTISVYEPDPQVSIIDPLTSLIDAYEQIINNLNALYKYNDTDAKLKIAGYRPENPLTIPNPLYKPEEPITSQNSPMIVNPARQQEDAYLLASKTFFVQEGGDVSWLLKEVNAEDATKYLKYYIDSIFQVSGIPNTNDAAFNSGDLNASAIDRKFYTMALMLNNTRQGVRTLIKHRWANFFARINLLNNTQYDINDLEIQIGTNLPSMKDETINQQLALTGILSQKTLLSNLGYDYATEKKNKELETEIPYETVSPDTAFVSPNDVDKLNEKTAAASTTEPTATDATAAQPKNKKAAKVTDKTDNIPNLQPREGRPNK